MTKEPFTTIRKKWPLAICYLVEIEWFDSKGLECVSMGKNGVTEMLL